LGGVEEVGGVQASRLLPQLPQVETGEGVIEEVNKYI